MSIKPHPETVTGEVLMFLYRVSPGHWATWGKSFYMHSVQQAFKVGTPEKVQLRFMQILIRKGLVYGCDCGCRGDFEINENGIVFLENELGRKLELH